MSDLTTHPMYNPNCGPIRTLNGRPCQILRGVRKQQHNKAWGFYTTHEVRYLDDLQPPTEIWPAAKLNGALRRTVVA